jgi:hypothetical protein
VWNEVEADVIYLRHVAITTVSCETVPRFSGQSFVYISYRSHTFYMPRPYMNFLLRDRKSVKDTVEWAVGYNKQIINNFCRILTMVY